MQIEQTMVLEQEILQAHLHHKEIMVAQVLAQHPQDQEAVVVVGQMLEAAQGHQVVVE